MENWRQTVASYCIDRHPSIWYNLISWLCQQTSLPIYPTEKGPRCPSPLTYPNICDILCGVLHTCAHILLLIPPVNEFVVMTQLQGETITVAVQQLS